MQEEERTRARTAIQKSARFAGLLEQKQLQPLDWTGLDFTHHYVLGERAPFVMQFTFETTAVTNSHVAWLRDGAAPGVVAAAWGGQYSVNGNGGMHGGAIATLLDIVVCSAKRGYHTTKSLKVDYKVPVPTECVLLVEARGPAIGSPAERLMKETGEGEVKAAILGEDGETVYALATAVVVSPKIRKVWKKIQQRQSSL